MKQHDMTKTFIVEHSPDVGPAKAKGVPQRLPFVKTFVVINFKDFDVEVPFLDV